MSGQPYNPPSAMATDTSVDTAGFGEQRIAWLIKNWRFGDAWLLAFQDDGVIWGKLKQGAITCSDASMGVSSPKLSVPRLWRLHLFNNDAELRLWMNAGDLHGAFITDGADVQDHHVDEELILWGTELVSTVNDFSHLREGERGIEHAVPYPITKEALSARKRVRLVTRQYIGFDPKTGEAFTAGYRLIKLMVG